MGQIKNIKLHIVTDIKCVVMSEHVAKAVLQQCLSARLQVQPRTDTTCAEYVQVKRGVVIFICFLKGARADILHKLAKTLLDVKLTYCERTGKRCSILELPGDVLIVPQATLGGKVKGKVVQYHQNIEKSEGKELYYGLVKHIEQMLTGNKAAGGEEGGGGGGGGNGCCVK